MLCNMLPKFALSLPVTINVNLLNKRPPRPLFDFGLTDKEIRTKELAWERRQNSVSAN